MTGRPGVRRVLVLGGARSGKSSFAERLAAECGEPLLYVATATAGDAEMAARIAQHRARRPAHWRTLEAPLDVAGQVAAERGAARTVLLEDLTLLLSNLILAGEADATEAACRAAEAVDRLDTAAAEAVERQAAAEVEALLALEVNVILVSNEVGMGLVPTSRLGRLFRDALGRLNQHAAALAGEVYFVAAGLPLRLK